MNPLEFWQFVFASAVLRGCSAGQAERMANDASEAMQRNWGADGEADEVD